MAKVETRGFLRLICLVAFIAVGYITLHLRNYPQFPAQTLEQNDLVSALSENDEQGKMYTGAKGERDHVCQMENCFDFDKCKNGFKVYVYPFEDGERVSANYAKIIRVVKKSVYYTDNPSEACVFVPSSGTAEQFLD